MEGTTVPPIWPVDRNDWVPLSELEEGERLQPTDGIATVLSISIGITNVPVYNIEVRGEYLYQVGELGLLVHNDCVCQAVDAAGNVFLLDSQRTLQFASRNTYRDLTLLPLFKTLLDQTHRQSSSCSMRQLVCPRMEASCSTKSIALLRAIQSMQPQFKKL